MSEPKARILIWDLETTELDADWGTLLCVGYKWLGQDEVTVLSITDYKGWNKTPAALLDDSKLWADFMKVYNQADLIVTYFGKGFDQKFLYAKLLKHGLEIPSNVPHIDLFFTAKANLKLRRKSMDNVTRYLGLQDEEIHKTPVTYEKWQLARVGDRDAIQYIIDHCRSDIKLTERLYVKFLPLIRTHPRVAGFGPCRSCGGNHISRQGYKLTTTQGRQIRIKCETCGSWDSLSEAAYNTKVHPYVRAA